MPTNLLVRITALRKILGDFFELALQPTSREFMQLSYDLGSDACARSALQDLLLDLPKTDQSWALAVEKSGAARWKHCLILCPSSHAIASLYPIAIGLAAGLELSLKLSRLTRTDGESSFLSSYVFLLKKHPLFSDSLRFIAKDFVIDRKNFSFDSLLATKSPVDVLLCYGTDETLENLRSSIHIPLAGFGHGVALSLLRIRDLQDTQSVCRLLAKDILSLGQNGCLSTRLLVMEDPGESVLRSFLKKLDQACYEFWGKDLDLLSRLSLEQDEVLYQDQWGSQVSFAESEFMFFPVFRRETLSELTRCLSTQRFVLPLVLYKNWRTVWTDLLFFPSLLRVSAGLGVDTELPPDDLIPKLVPLGQGNLLSWDGTHEGKPLFKGK